MAELSRRSGVPVATIKYYRREGLLPPGDATAPNQATYTQQHVHRLRLVRALRDVAGLPVATIGEVLGAVDDPDRPLFEVVGVAHAALARSGGGPLEDSRAAADEVIERAGWHVGEQAPARADLARALATLEELGAPPDPTMLDRYIRAADLVASEEVTRTMDPARSRDEVVTGVIVGTVLYEQVLTALRRLAQEHHARQAY